MDEGAAPIRVLHVDDEPDFAELVATYLEREDERFEVRTATGPDAGLDLLDGADVDCVVSDYDMPGTTGIELLEAVREEYPDLPFVLYTGKGSEEVASEAISAGVTDYLQKESGTSQYALLANRISNAVEQHRSSRAIAETERKLSELAERTDDVLFMVDGDWAELLFVNSAYEDVWASPVEELRADPRSLLERVHPDDEDDVRAAVAGLQDGERAELQFRVVRPDGTRRWVRGDLQPIRGAEGGVARIVGQLRDVTEQTERQLRLETVVDNLPGYVYRHAHEPEYPLRFVKGDAETVTGYTTDELEEDVRLAEEIIHPDDREHIWEKLLDELEERGRFDSTYRIITKSGDVRWIRDQGQLVEDPVTGEQMIDGFITDVSERKRRERELRRQQLLIEEGLDALGTGRDAEGTEPVDLRAAVGDAWSMASEGRPGVDLAVAEALPTVEAEPEGMRQLLENLFEDAVERGDGAVTVTVGPTAGGFYVEHDGAGLPGQASVDAFAPEYAMRDDGVGLGLWLVEQLAGAHGWGVDATERDDGGVRFEVTGVGE